MACQGKYAGSPLQLVAGERNLAMSGGPPVAKNVYVAGDRITMIEGRVRWPYVSTDWNKIRALDGDGSGEKVSTMSFSWVSLDGKNGGAALLVSSSAAASVAPANSASVESGNVQPASLHVKATPSSAPTLR